MKNLITKKQKLNNTRLKHPQLRVYCIKYATDEIRNKTKKVGNNETRKTTRNT